MARAFHEFLGKVEHGETVRILKHGRPVARMIPDSSFMNGRIAAGLFRSYKASDEDIAAADAIESEVRKLENEDSDALAH